MDRRTLFWIIGIIAIIFIAGAYMQKSSPLFAISLSGQGYCIDKKINLIDAIKLEKFICVSHPSSNWDSIIEASPNLYQFNNWNNHCCNFDFLISGNQGVITNNWYVNQGLCTEPPDISDLSNFFCCNTQADCVVIPICQKMTCAIINVQCGSWSDNCGGTLSCGTCQYGTCNSAGKCICNSTPADTNCDNIVSRTELRDYGLKWINAQISRDELGTAIQVWSSG